MDYISIQLGVIGIQLSFIALQLMIITKRISEK